MDTYDRFDNKRILIWGYGREGKSTEEFLSRFCSPALVDIFEGKREDMNESDYDFIIKSPGIVMNEDDDRFTSQTQIFLECFRDNIVGITGTKGKSTTSSLLHHVLKSCGRKTLLVGNIGLPCLDCFRQVDEDTAVVFEMSCHQLAHVNVSPHIAVFLNLFEEHLDYYKTLDNYFAAKSRITSFQTEGDVLYAGGNVPNIPTDARIKRIDFNEVPDYEMKIMGHHNSYNAHFVFRIATEEFGLDPSDVKEAISSFTGLAHRLQHLGCIDGVDYYDDSIATIPGAAIEALGSVKNAGCILIGGMDRGIDYSDLIRFINEHREYDYIFSYESGKRIYESVEPAENCRYAETLEEAVLLAKKITEPGKAILLSPASASYGHFKNFEERGDVFKKLCGF